MPQQMYKNVKKIVTSDNLLKYSNTLKRSCKSAYLVTYLKAISLICYQVFKI